MNTLSARYINALEYLRDGGQVSVCTSFGRCLGKANFAPKPKFQLSLQTLYTLFQYGYVNAIVDEDLGLRWTHIAISKLGIETLKERETQ